MKPKPPPPKNAVTEQQAADPGTKQATHQAGREAAPGRHLTSPSARRHRMARCRGAIERSIGAAMDGAVLVDGGAL